MQHCPSTNSKNGFLQVFCPEQALRGIMISTINTIHHKCLIRVSFLQYYKNISLRLVLWRVFFLWVMAETCCSVDRRHCVEQPAVNRLFSRSCSAAMTPMMTFFTVLLRRCIFCRVIRNRSFFCAAVFFFWHGDGHFEFTIARRTQTLTS